MRERRWHHRLTGAELTRLAACKPKLDAIYDAIRATGLGGKASLMQHCQEVFDTIHEVLVEEDKAVARHLGRLEARKSRAAALEGAVEAVTKGEGSGRPAAQEDV